jgi:hypothetical protein
MSLKGEESADDPVDSNSQRGRGSISGSCLYNINSGACCTTYNAIRSVSDRIQMQAVRLKVASRGGHTFLPSLDTRPAGGVRLR